MSRRGVRRHRGSQTPCAWSADPYLDARFVVGVIDPGDIDASIGIKGRGFVRGIETGIAVGGMGIIGGSGVECDFGLPAGRAGSGGNADALAGSFRDMNVCAGDPVVVRADEQ